MAIGPDRVQLIKRESAALGGDPADDVDYLEPIQAQEDAIEAAGLYLQDSGARDEQVWLERNGNDMRFFDVTNPGGFTLAELATGNADHGKLIFIGDGGLVYSTAGDVVLKNIS